ncbi:hypothetical protein RIR_jg32037.t1 [Rhizophagus irregularis DAOM 181602=DAOM 197198]|nr:hypothetical protein RIR_jg32037.t1 [Rhizophagus irregularis DAOM 181602=DAOM 197198]
MTCSPDLNLIETAFTTINQFLKRNQYFVDVNYNPMYPLLIACSQITPQMAILENLDIFKNVFITSASQEEMPDDLDDGYNGYGRYNKYE